MADHSNTRNDLWRSVSGLQRVYLDSFTQIANGMAEATRFGMDAARTSVGSLTEATRMGTIALTEAARLGSMALTVTTRRGLGPQPSSEILHDQVIDVGEEVLEVGKERVTGATTRVRRVITRVPTEELVELYDETVVVERLPPGNAEPEADALLPRDYFMQDVREVAVVTKRMRLRERVRLHRERTPRIETIHEVLTKTDVEVEQPRQMSVVAP